MRRLTRRWMLVGAGAILTALALAPEPAAAQRTAGVPLNKNGDPDMRAGKPRRFNLFGLADEAYSDIKTASDKYDWGVSNTRGELDAGLSWGSLDDAVSSGPAAGTFGTYIYINFAWATPPSVRDSIVAAVTRAGGDASGLAQTIGGGYNVRYSGQLNATDVLLASDNQLGPYMAGVTSTQDKTCLDHTRGFLAGNPLMPGSDCPQTWGSLGWQGRKPVPEAEYLNAARTGGPNFGFDFWKFASGEPDPAGKLERQFGNFQTYGFFNDYTKDEVCGTAQTRSYGLVMRPFPNYGACADQPPKKPGYPLGLEVRFDAFAYAIPALADVIFMQISVANNSALVYGVPIDYDSLYIGLMPAPYSDTQSNPAYSRADLNALISTGDCVHQQAGSPCNGAAAAADLTPANVIAASLGGAGYPPWEEGTAALIMLKSPIGDTRNKLFSRPGTPWYDLRGTVDPGILDDTITFNHRHFCGFRACERTTHQLNYETNPDAVKRQFGMLSSTEVNVLGTRTPSTLTPAGGIPGQILWHTFRSADFPDAPDVGTGPGDFPQTGGFNRWIPGNFDWNEDGIADTLYYDDCSTKYGGTSIQTACVGLYSDTMPHAPSKPPYRNGYGNSSGVMTVGPIRLAAGDTVGFVLAATSACCGSGLGDSLALITKVNAAIDHYMNFFLGPEPLPRDTIVAVEVIGGNQLQSQVTLRFTQTAEESRDPFLLNVASKLGAPTAGTPDDRLVKLNPFLEDSLLAFGVSFGADTVNAGGDAVTGVGNFSTLYVFKSCDGGATFTNNADCRPSPATGGKFASLGWLPYATIARSASGDVPNTFTDPNVNGGMTYTYILVGESRGANFTVQVGDSVAPSGQTDENGDPIFVCVRGCSVRTVNYAPSLLNTLSTSGSNVAVVYVPASLQAGGAGPLVQVTALAGAVPASRVIVTPAANFPRAGTYKVAFYDRVEVVVRDSLDADGRVRLGTTSTVTGFQGATASTPMISTKLGGVGLNGATLDSSKVDLEAGYRIRSNFYSFDGLTALLTFGDTEPVLVTSQFDADATPETFFSSSAFPGFLLGFEDSDELAFNTTFGEQFTDEAGRAIAPLVTPFVRTRTAITVLGGGGEGGLYRFTWTDKPYGPGEPFRVTRADPSQTQTAVTNSLNGRTAGQTGAVTQEVADAIGGGTEPADLVPVKVPFTIFNESFNRPVTVAMKARASNSIRLGSGSDTVTVTVPADQWIPNDQLILLEDVDGTGPGGLVVTFTSYVLGCNASTMTYAYCNPVALLTPGATNYISTRPGTEERVLYNPVLTTGQQFRITVSAQRAGDDLTNACTTSGETTVCASVKSSIKDVKAVPNPYVVFSQFTNPRDPTNTTRPMMFTHVPASGVLRIYTVSGQLVQQLTWTPSDLNGTGDLLWNLRSREGLEIAGGLYLFRVTGRDASGKEVGSHMGKFVIIR